MDDDEEEEDGDDVLAKLSLSLCLSEIQWTQHVCNTTSMLDDDYANNVCVRVCVRGFIRVVFFAVFCLHISFQYYCEGEGTVDFY